MASPTLQRKTLGAELRKLRTAAGGSIEQVAELLGCSTGKVSHIETGRNSPSKTELMVLMDHYSLPSDHRKLLEETRQEARKRGWWSTYRLPSWFRDYVGMETDASRVRTFEIELLPGLLQTEEYMRAINVLGSHITDPSEVERQVALRLERQKRLRAEEPLEVTAVISEASLARCASDPTLAITQFSHLVEAAQQPNILLQVLPFRTGLHSSMTGSFTLLDFPPETWPPTAYQEYAVGGHLVDEQEAVSALSTVFTHLQERALNVEDSIKLIENYAQA
ncbi:helix-turn-helix protein [Halopolyspora algeriensis]|uniref:Helix-turn-helix protein n=1 Tax=Halopolyspora algeriensis TaxID=1500506 RepID=A0A368V8E5_9ACTN|nr:helix-turn-helix transcriptional regulator [Halopolyspora algeriensis]RCW37477.1 helix-turn-helix protein [Halopolyspora algeriensis]TQM42575.1 helix-turn-helix protein [Halopolyspora algeriensis]